jgi:hypothetical protein
MNTIDKIDKLISGEAKKNPFSSIISNTSEIKTKTQAIEPTMDSSITEQTDIDTWNSLKSDIDTVKGNIATDSDNVMNLMNQESSDKHEFMQGGLQVAISGEGLRNKILEQDGLPTEAIDRCGVGNFVTDCLSTINPDNITAWLNDSTGILDGLDDLSGSYTITELQDLYNFLSDKLNLLVNLKDSFISAKDSDLSAFDYVQNFIKNFQVLSSTEANECLTGLMIDFGE